jgi:hypothetical protein
MADTKELWYDKLESWVPKWFFAEPELQEAYWWGIAAVMEAVECAILDHQRETFICLSENPYLEEHGLERGLTQGETESDASFCLRIQSIINTANCPYILESVRGLLNNNPELARIVEHVEQGAFFDREFFYNSFDAYQAVPPEEIDYNFFTLIIPVQYYPTQGAYMNNESFMDNEDFYSSWPRVEIDQVYSDVINFVNGAKAAGVLWRLLVFGEPDQGVLDG